MSQLNQEELYKWRLAMCEMWLSEQKQRVAELQMTNMAKDIENSQLKLQLFKQSVLKSAQEARSVSKQKYDEVVKSLSVDIAGKIVNEYTGDVQDEVDLV
jgi:regulator of replication initiation timing